MADSDGSDVSDPRGHVNYRLGLEANLVSTDQDDRRKSFTMTDLYLLYLMGKG